MHFFEKNKKICLKYLDKLTEFLLIYIREKIMKKKGLNKMSTAKLSDRQINRQTNTQSIHTLFYRFALIS